MIPRIRVVPTYDDADPPAVVPIVEPVTLADLKAHLVVDGSQDDVLLAELITVAREACEDLTGRAIPQQSVVVTLDQFPGGREMWWDGVRDLPISYIRRQGKLIELPRPPLISVESITAYDDADVATVMPDTDYYVDASDPNQPGRIALRIGAIWPAIVLRTANAVEIAATIGYAVVPSALARAIMMMAADLYANRGDGWSGSLSTRAGATTTSAVRSGAMTLLERYVIRSL